MLWCGHCMTECDTACHGDFLSCTVCGKVLGQLNCQRRFKTRNPEFKRRKRRRSRRRNRQVVITVDQSCVTDLESPVNIVVDNCLSNTEQLTAECSSSQGDNNC